jgi:hypothetical protein
MAKNYFHLFYLSWPGILAELEFATGVAGMIYS